MIKTAKIVGLNSDQLAAQALAIQHSLETSYFFLVSCIGEDAYSKIRQALSTAEESLTDLQGEQLSHQLETLLKTLQESLKETEEQAVLVAATHKRSLYLIRSNTSVDATLWRKDQATQLSSLAPEKKLISGLLQPGDRIVLATTSLTAALGEHQSKLSTLELDSIEDEVAPQVSTAKTDPIAALVIDFGEVPTSEAPAGIPESPVQEDPISKSWRQLHFKIPHLPHINQLKPHTRQQYMYTTIAIVTLVALSVGGYTWQHKATIEHQQFETFYQKASQEYAQAQAFKDSDGPAAKQNLDSAKANIAAALKVSPKQSQGLELQKQIIDNTGTILKLTVVNDFTLWLDLDLVKKNFTTQNLSFSVDKLLVLDSTQKSLVAIDIAKKANQILTGGDKLGDAQFATVNGENAFSYSPDKGIFKIEIPTSGTVKEPVQIVKKDDNWGHVSDIYAFAGNIYIVDEFKNSVWKYLPIASGYSDAQSYFSDGLKVDLAGTRKMQIDGSVWILKNDGELLKFTQGNRDFFSYNGLDNPIASPKSFFTSSETTNLYLLDSGNSRLVVLDKKGNYISQYQSDKFGEFTDLVVDEPNRKILLLNGSKIYQIAL